MGLFVHYFFKPIETNSLNQFYENLMKLIRLRIPFSFVFTRQTYHNLAPLLSICNFVSEMVKMVRSGNQIWNSIDGDNSKIAEIFTKWNVILFVVGPMKRNNTLPDSLNEEGSKYLRRQYYKYQLTFSAGIWQPRLKRVFFYLT